MSDVFFYSSLKGKSEMELESGVVGGTWRFRKGITIAELDVLAQEWIESKHARGYALLYTGECHDGRHIIMFVYSSNETSAKRSRFLQRMLTIIEDRFGKDSVNWHVGSPLRKFSRSS